VQKEHDGLYFERLGSRFDQWMSEYDVSRRAILISALLPRDASARTCLEVGCGTGRISEVIAPLVKDLTVCDISAELAKRTGVRLAVVASEQDAVSLTFPDGSFDLVVSSECIEHTPDPRKALREMVRVLRPGGVIIVTSPNAVWYFALMIAQALKIRSYAGPEKWLLPWVAAADLRSFCMRDVTLSGCHLFPWQIPLAKSLLPFFDRFGKILYPFMVNFAVCAVKNCH